LESLGWYGLVHLHAHDKTAGVELGDAGQYLMSLCFCPSCRDGYTQRGLAPDELAASVRRALEPVWRGEAPTGAWEAVEKLLGAELATATRAWRDSVARSLQSEADGVVVPCAGGPELLTPFAEQAVERSVLAANFPVVRGMGGSPGTLAEDVARAVERGATEVRLYHAGLASDEDLSLVAEALARLG
jgi:hypothetical protein